jgi:adenylate kinase
VDRLLEQRGAEVNHVLLVEVTDQELVRRILGRARKEGRSDDTRETIEQRLKVYRQQTAPLVASYRERGLVRVIEGMGSIREIAGRVQQAVRT